MSMLKDIKNSEAETLKSLIKISSILSNKLLNIWINLQLKMFHTNQNTLVY